MSDAKAAFSAAVPSFMSDIMAGSAAVSSCVSDALVGSLSAGDAIAPFPSDSIAGLAGETPSFLSYVKEA